MTKTKNEKREIPFKNYIMLGVIIISTLLISLYIFSWYRQYSNNTITKPIITSTLREVEYDNLPNVLQERDVLVMYMCTTSQDICRNFEKKFSEYIKDNNLSEEIIYLNLGYSNDENNLLNKVYQEYKSDNLVKKVYQYPTLLIFNQGKIVDVLSSSNKHKINIEQVDEFLESYELW